MNKNEKIFQNGILREAHITPPSSTVGTHKLKHYKKRDKIAHAPKYQRTNKDKEFKRHFKHWLNS